MRKVTRQKEENKEMKEGEKKDNNKRGEIRQSGRKEGEMANEACNGHKIQGLGQDRLRNGSCWVKVGQIKKVP